MDAIEKDRRDVVSTASLGKCPACSSDAVVEFFWLDNVPTNSCILLDTEEEARSYPTGRIALGVCNGCGFVINTAFNPKLTEYSGRYEETQSFSPAFNRFHTEMANRLIEKYDLRSKTVLEVGCGKGEFLVLLAELGNMTGIGIDPGVKPERVKSSASERLTFIPDFYSEKYGSHAADFLVCKMTLEHIPDVAEFLATLRRGLGDQTDTVVFFQVPEASRILRTCAFEDIYYEHCSYFTPGSLSRAFRSAGFDVIDTLIQYDDQYLTIEARPRPNDAAAQSALASEDDVEDILSLAYSFQERAKQAIAVTERMVQTAVDAGKTVAIWGSGSKAVSLMTSCGFADSIAAVTDVNPFRHGRYIPVTGHRIVPPDELTDVRPDLVLVMNRVYEPEIRAQLSEMGLNPEIFAL